MDEQGKLQQMEFKWHHYIKCIWDYIRLSPIRKLPMAVRVNLQSYFRDRKQR